MRRRKPDVDEIQAARLRALLADHFTSHEAIRLFANQFELRSHAERVGASLALDFAGLAHRDRGAKDLALHAWTRADYLLKPSRARDQNSVPRIVN